jgi:hypothetical protein
MVFLVIKELRMSYPSVKFTSDQSMRTITREQLITVASTHLLSFTPLSPMLERGFKPIISWSLHLMQS